MRILILSQFFYPDEAPASQLLTDLALDLATAGHEVSVLTGSATGGGTERGYRARASWRGIHIHRVFCGRSDRRSRLRRGASYARYLGGALLRLLLMRRTPDVVLVVPTPPLVGALAAILQRLRGVPFLCWVQRLPLEALAPPAAQKQRWRTWMCERAALLVVTGNSMRSRLLKQGVAPARVRVIHNWADGRTLAPIPREQNAFPGKHQLDGKFLLLYPGDWEPSDEFETLLEAMRLLREEPGIRLVMTGEGPQRPGFEERCRQLELDQVLFVSRPARTDLAYALGAADLGLVTLRPGWEGMASPVRVYELMAAGRPWLSIGPAGSDLEEMARQHGCGWQVEAGDASGLADLIRRLAQSPELLQAAGQRARAAFTARFDRPLAVKAIEGALQSAGRHSEMGANSAGTAATARLSE